MDIKFYKLEVNGNDFILINYLYQKMLEPALLSLIAMKLCKRRSGVGASGVLFLAPGDSKRINVLHYMPNGNWAELHNDALICAGKFIFDSALADKDSIVIEINQECRTIDVIDSDSFRINLGVPLDQQGAELREKPDEEYTHSITIEKKVFVYSPITLERTGAVLFFHDKDREKRKLIVPFFEKYDKGCFLMQPVFGDVLSRDSISIATYDKIGYRDGAFAAGVSAVAAVVNGFCEREQTARIRKGIFFVQWMETQNIVLVTGTPRYTFTGSYYLDEYIVSQFLESREE